MPQRLSKLLAVLACSAVLFTGVCVQSMQARAASQPAPQPKEWTMLVYLNGDNNLDSFGKLNINQMEKVGSNDAMNIVVQWASLANGKTQRLLVQKDNDPDNVTSPIVQDMGKVDMGDYKSLTDFIAWGAQNYPARHYLVDVWDHGSGWHSIHAMSGGLSIKPMDISYDETTGHWINTQQLGQALRDGAKAIGHKIDIYGSDACLMAMAEIASEVSDSVSYFAGSQEVEPGAGWPYDAWLQRVVANRGIDAPGVAKALSEEYVKSYQGGENGTQEVTFSAFDLSKLDAFEAAVKKVGSSIQSMDSGSRKTLAAAARKTQSFTNMDYDDLLDFLQNAESSHVNGLDSRDLSELREATKSMVIANHDTDQYKKATGLSIWLPTQSYTYENYSKQYQGLRFEAQTGWNEALKSLVADADSSPSGGDTPVMP